MLTASYLADKKRSDERCSLSENVLQMVGKLFAFLNMAVVILGCMFQFTGVYSCCDCQSNRIGMRPSFMVFLDPETSADISKNFWWGGIVMALVPCLACMIWFSFGQKIRSALADFRGAWLRNFGRLDGKRAGGS